MLYQLKYCSDLDNDFPEDAIENKPDITNAFIADHEQKPSPVETGQQEPDELPMHQSNELVGGKTNKVVNGDRTKHQDAINGMVSSQNNNTNEHDTKFQDQGNVKISSQSNITNRNDTKFKGNFNGKTPSVDKNRVKHEEGVLKKVGKLYSKDGSKWIKCRSNAESGLPYSGRFHNGMISLKLHGEGCLLTSTEKYVARVKIDKIDELDLATKYDDAIKILESNLIIVDTLLDVDFENIKNAKETFDKCVTDLSTNSFDVVQHARDLFQISLVLQKFKNDKKNMLDHINTNQNISGHLKQIIIQYVKVCADYEKRKGFFEKVFTYFKSSKQSWIDVLECTLKNGIYTHKQKALEMCPTMMKDDLAKISDSKIFFVTSSDVKLFADMENTLDKNIFETVLPTLIGKYCEVVAKLQPNESTRVTHINNPIYFYLCKSLTEVVQEINTRTKDDFEAWYNGEWKHKRPIRWTSSSPSLMDKCIERELKMLIRMLDHFEPGKPSALQNFDHKFEIFTSISKSNQHDTLPSEIHVWLCLLDDTIENVLDKNRNVDDLCSSLLKLYKSCSETETSTMDSMESLRIITHNTIKYLALAAPFFNSKNGLDRDITLSQIKTMQWATTGGQMSSFMDHRDLVEVFSHYWKVRGEFADEISAKLPGDFFEDHVDIVENILLNSMREALRKKVELTELISFCRAYDELLVDLLDLSYDWYVRIEKGEIHDIIMKRGLVDLVQNKWQASEHKCFRVTNVSKFSGLYSGLSSEDSKLPKHYILETVKNLLHSIYSMMITNQWKGGAQLTELEQISSTSLMIASVRSCLIYLKEQPEYIDFDKFLEENSKPFVTLSAKCTSFEEFKKRVLLIKESFWYLRNQNTIGIEEALKLFKVDNINNYNEDYLRMAYKIYSEQFEIYMAPNEEMNTEEKIQHIVTEVKSTVVNKLTPEWDIEFKRNVLPRLLAGLGAVWALHASKDVAIAGQFLKPHCIQVLGVLRLLSADNDTQGVKKHLAQILTGQGKSLVLGMMACALALCGHSVTIMCYSEYLATRDQQDFDDFYDYFAVRSKINYMTFGMAASEEFNRYSSNAQAHVYKCIGFSSPLTNNPVKRPANPVLLIDEVDVFFNEELFGKPYILGTMLRIPGLAEVQKEIWRLVTNGVQNIRQSIDTFISNQSCETVATFNTLMNKPGSFMLLECNQNKMVDKTYSNSTLFSNHLNEMIKTAEKVYKQDNASKVLPFFRINENGNICCRTAFGIYSESFIWNYYNTFIYFLLKKQDFQPDNYGYLVLDLGCTSFAKLPESYPLILGVTGTLTNLGQYEKKVVKEYYKITESSVMPSFFGGSNLEFNESSNVNCLKTTTEWMNTIFSRINAIVNDKRAVLAIFDTEESINCFKQQFGGQLDRLNVLTVNTKPPSKKVRLIDESGVSKTITLATREMGRGVDYKSSVTVEKHGGVHVIQTFFSLDIKEETQIKGRTARKDNRGSYEMILCYEHLEYLNLQICDFEAGITYRKLSDARDLFNEENDNSRDDSVQKSNEMHEKTIEFYGKV